MQVEETVSALSSLLLHNDHTKEVNGVVGCSEKKSATVSGQKVEMEKREGLSNITPELVINSPTSLMDVKHGATALPLCPPNTAVPSSLHAGLLQPQEVPCFTNAASPFEEPPPPYTLLPPVYPQLPVASTSQEGQAMTEANLIQCAVCKYEGKYCQSPGRMISLVRCSRCKEHTVCYIYRDIILPLHAFFAAAGGATTHWQSVWTLCLLPLPQCVFYCFQGTQVSQRDMASSL